ncbi:MAG: hypothetical protein HWD57_05040 [Candidatus Accumulibacter cognatus]|uniref:Uncharacterized protein n=1 Tax=Candidatus Accumulibacter cognatus TaxID=2954383 RepID=A0A7D5SAV7_9PROT|nr:MAG: hypothetical protein HWD57_05040 [Candidatus Accumulibacter cognatus]
MNNISMKNVIMGSVLAVAAVTSLSANAVTVCTGGGAGNGASFAAGTNFVKQDFTPKCSANVFMDGEETSATVFRAGAASAKGKYYFGGSTVGGAVGNIDKCAGAACAQTDSQAGLAAASAS